MEVREVILKRVARQFFEYGYSRVTMDDIASEAGISKKTLYKHFSSKKEILRSIVAIQMEEMRICLEAIFGDPDLGFLGKMRKMLQAVVSLFSRIGSGFLQDVYRNAPEIWQEIDAFRQEVFFSRIEKLIHEGYERGLIRKEIDQRVIVLLYTQIIQNIITPVQLINLSLSPQELLESLVTILYAGILTDSARAEIFSTLYPTKKESAHGND